MKVYLVVASDYEGCSIEEVFNDKKEAEKYSEFKNKYKTPWNKYDKFAVIEKELLEKADLTINEDDLCVKIEGYIHLYDNDEEEIEYNLMVKEDWCVTNYTGFDDFISATVYVNLTKEEYDNFDSVKYEYVFKDLKEKIIKMHKQGIDGKDISDKLNEEINL